MDSRFHQPEWQQALLAAESLPATPKNLDRLSKNLSPQLALWATQQIHLRLKAKEKFPDAHRLLFSKDGLEMATHHQVANWHAELFPRNVHVVDLTSGIGADTIALAARGEVTAVDQNPEHCEILRYNLHQLQLKATVRCESAQEYLANTSAPYIFLDPARRSSSRRFIDPQDFSPNVLEFLPALQSSQLAVIKLSPMLPDEFLESLGGSLTFVSHQSECKEAIVQLGQTANPGRCAYKIETGEQLPCSSQKLTHSDPKSYIYEADPAAIRAHCLPSFSLDQVGETPGYLTSQEPLDSPWLTRYPVIWSGAYRPKAIKSILKDHGLAVATVKTRGVKEDPILVKKLFRSAVGKPAILMLYKRAESIQVALVQKSQ